MKAMKALCGLQTTGPADCLQCCVAHASTLMTPPQTGTYVNCAASDFTPFCAAIPTRHINGTGCRLLPNQPKVFGVLCASRDKEADCTQALYEPTCEWETPSGGAPPGCTACMTKVCTHGGRASCQACLVAHNKSLLTRPQTGSYCNCAIDDFTTFCDSDPGPPTPGGTCPGGSLSNCIALCPTAPPIAYKDCVANCVKDCKM